MWTQTQKIQYVSRVLNITPRSVYRRMQRGELNVDQFNFPERWIPEPPKPLPDYQPGANQNGVQTKEIPVETGHDGQPAQSMDTRPDVTGPDKPGVSLSSDQVMEAIIALGEMRERVKWLSAENTYLKREIGLLKAPPEEPAELKEQELQAMPEPVKEQRPTWAQRIQMSWQVLVRGGTPQQPST